MSDPMQNFANDALSRPSSVAVGGGDTLAVQSSMSTMTTDFKDALRSFRDSLTFSLQTLNLTMSTLGNSMTNLGVKIGQLGTNGGQFPSVYGTRDSQFIRPGELGVFNGNYSAAMANYAGRVSTLDLLRGIQPYNISRQEYNMERPYLLANRLSNWGLAGIGAGLESWAGMYGSGAILRNMSNRVGIDLEHSKYGGLLSLGANIYAGGGLYGLASGLARTALEPIITSGIQHNNDSEALRRMSSLYGQQFNAVQARAAMRQIHNLGFEDIQSSGPNDIRMGAESYKQMALMGIQTKMFQGTSPEELVGQVREAAGVVKMLTGILGSPDVRSTMESIKQLKDMGINVFKDQAQAMRMVKDAVVTARTTGTDASTLLNQSINASAAAYGQYGLPAFAGIGSAMKNFATVRELEKRGMLTPTDIAMGGGVESIAARRTAVEAQYAQSDIFKMQLASVYNAGSGKVDLSGLTKALESQNPMSIISRGLRNNFSDGLANVYAFKGDYPEVIAQMAKDGKLQDTTQASLDNFINKMILPATGINMGKYSSREQQAIYTGLLEQAAQEMGLSIDHATAKSMAIEKYNPLSLRFMNGNGSRYTSAALYRDFRNQVGLLSGLDNAMNEGSKFMDRIRHFQESLGMDISDGINGGVMGFLGTERIPDFAKVDDGTRLTKNRMFNLSDIYSRSNFIDRNNRADITSVLKLGGDGASTLFDHIANTHKYDYSVVTGTPIRGLLGDRIAMERYKDFVAQGDYIDKAYGANRIRSADYLTDSSRMQYFDRDINPIQKFKEVANSTLVTSLGLPNRGGSSISGVLGNSANFNVDTLNSNVSPYDAQYAAALTLHRFGNTKFKTDMEDFEAKSYGALKGSTLSAGEGLLTSHLDGIRLSSIPKELLQNLVSGNEKVASEAIEKIRSIDANAGAEAEKLANRYNKYKDQYGKEKDKSGLFRFKDYMVPAAIGAASVGAMGIGAAISSTVIGAPIGAVLMGAGKVGLTTSATLAAGMYGADTYMSNKTASANIKGSEEMQTLEKAIANYSGGNYSALAAVEDLLKNNPAQLKAFGDKLYEEMKQNGGKDFKLKREDFTNRMLASRFILDFAKNNPNKLVMPEDARDILWTQSLDKDSHAQVLAAAARSNSNSNLYMTYAGIKDYGGFLSNTDSARMDSAYKKLTGMTLSQDKELLDKLNPEERLRFDDTIASIASGANATDVLTDLGKYIPNFKGKNDADIIASDYFKSRYGKDYAAARDDKEKSSILTRAKKENAYFYDKISDSVSNVTSVADEDLDKALPGWRDGLDYGTDAYKNAKKSAVKVVRDTARVYKGAADMSLNLSDMGVASLSSDQIMNGFREGFVNVLADMDTSQGATKAQLALKQIMSDTRDLVSKGNTSTNKEALYKKIESELGTDAANDIIKQAGGSNADIAEIAKVFSQYLVSSLDQQAKDQKAIASTTVRSKIDTIVKGEAAVVTLKDNALDKLTESMDKLVYALNTNSSSGLPTAQS